MGNTTALLGLKVINMDSLDRSGRSRGDNTKMKSVSYTHLDVYKRQDKHVITAAHCVADPSNYVL